MASSLSAAVAPGPDASGYTVLPTTNFAFSQIAFTTNQHVLWQGTDDQAFTVTNIGFAFPFYGTNYTNVSFNVNGLMTFGSPSMDPTNVNLTTTSPTNNQPCIAVLWDDWYSPLFGADGVYYKTTGTAGSRQFIVQWNKVIPVYGPGSDFVIFEVRFFEGSGNILCSYLDTVVSDDATNPPIATLGISATVGIRDTSGQSNGRNLQWSFNQGIVTNGLNLLFVPTNHVPVANADAVTLAEDSTATLNLLANDTDADGDVLKWTGFTQATNGIVTSNANGTVTYTPATNYFGADNFTYSIADGRGGSATGLVSIIVSPVNDVPTLNSLTNWALLEDAGTQIVYLTGISTGASNETDTLTVTVSSSDPAIIPAPTITYSSPDATGTLSFASATNAFGTVTITVTVNDGQASNNVVSRSFTVTITPMNDPPIAYDDSAATLENTPVTISPLLNDFDVEGDALTLLGADTTHGTVSILDETNLLFTPSSNFFGYATITYTNSDGHGGTASALVSVLVNDPPMLSHITDQTNDEDVVIGPLPFIMADRETPATNLLLVITSTNTLLLPTNQIVLAGSDTNRTLTLTPTTNLSGTTHVTLTLTDEFGATASDSFLVTVLPVNDAPFANDQTVTTPEDSATNLLLAATDVDSTNFIFAILTAPTNGVISGFDTNSGAFTYTPSTNYSGPDFIRFTVSDGSLLATGLVSITVSPVNDAPIAFSLSLTNAEDAALPITLTSFDVDGPVTNVTVLSSPTNGTLTGTAPNVVYQPATNYNGPDSFTFTVNDGSLTSAVATVSITVTPVNDAPIAGDQSITTPEDTATNLFLAATDVDSTNLAFAVLSPPTNGVITGFDTNTGAFTYTPHMDYNGPDFLSFTVSDGSLLATGLVSITVSPVNDAPVAFSLSLTNAEDTALPITLTSFDVDGPVTNFTVLTSPTNGTLTGTAPNLVYQPATNYNGLDSFTFMVNDGALTSAVAAVTITVTPVNDAPIANADFVTTAEDTPVTFNPLLNDTEVEGDTLTIIGAIATNGTVVILDATNLFFTPTTNFTGLASIVYTNSDGHGGSAFTTVTVTVTPVNDPPVANDDSVTTSEDTPVILNPLLNDTDADGDALTIIGAIATNGTVVIVDQTNLVFTPDTNFNGIASINYTNADGHGGTAFATVTVTVTPVNDPPIANDDSISTPEDTPVTFNPLLNDADTDGDALTILGASATNGTVAILNQTNLLFTPATNFNGTASIIYTNNDGHGGSAVARVTVTVTPVNDAPIARDDSVVMQHNTPVTIHPLLNDSDVDGDALTLVAAVTTSGTVAILDQTNLVFAPEVNFSGLVFITYTNSDGNGGTAFATITVLVNDPPVAVDDSVSTAEDAPVTFNPLINDSDVDGDTLTIISATATNGTVAILNQTNLLFTPATNFNGVTSIIYRNHDGHGETAVATVTVTVTPVNDAPIARDDTAATRRNTPVTIRPLLNDSDVDGDALTLLTATATNGAVAILDQTNLVFTPDTNFSGLAFITYTNSDGNGGTAFATITVLVNDPPVATDDSVSTAEDTPLTFNPLLNDSDADGDALTILGATATNGTVTILNQTNLLFTPATNFNGTASIIYTNSDGYGETAFATVTITVTPASDPPVAMPDAADTCVNVSLVLPCAVLLANDRDPDTGGVLTVTNVSPVSSGGGSVSLADGSVSYVPFTNFTGLDSFTYTVRNVAGDQATGTVVVKVWPTLNILTIAAQTNGNMLIRFCGLHGTNYEMEASTNFAGWNNLGPLTEGVPGVFQFEDTNTAGLDKRFYRVLSP